MEDEVKKKVVDMFFKEEKKQIDIARILNISKYKVSRLVTKDIRYQNEKEKRKQISQQKHTENTKQYIASKRKTEKMNSNTEDLILKNMHIQASMELSQGKKITNTAYRNWNKSAYLYNQEKKRFEFRSELGRSYDVPKYVKVNL